jgi:hypothetical protein
MRQRTGKALTQTAAIIALVSTVGCSVATAAMKSQIASQCGGVGLKGCPEIAEGAIAYAGGNEKDGEAKLRSAAAQNSPEQVRRLTKALAPILEAADADTAKKLQTVLAILEGKTDLSAPESPATPAAKAAGQVKAAAKIDQAPPIARTIARPEIDNLRAGMINLTTESQMLPCDPSMSDAKTCGRVRVLLGPFVLTNVYTSGGCSEDLFITSADSKAQWTMLAVAGDRMNVTGHFPVEEGQSLYVGAKGNAPAKNDLHCAIVWSGFRPAEKAVARPPYGSLGDGE